jgi:YegS/Rv2252/BmrU family lipid kinase
MTRRKAVLISNPLAGGGQSRRASRIARFCDALVEEGVDVEVAQATGPISAGRLVQRAVQNGATDIVIHGGDGTINEALQGLVGVPVRVAVWPGGTANVLARELQMPVSPTQAATIIAEGCTKLIYVARAMNEISGYGRYFILMAGIGLDASVVYSVRPGLKRLFGEAAFWYSGLSQLARWKPEKFQVEVGNRKYPATFAVIGKCSRYGGNLAVTPRARLDEPEFEICIINSTSRLRYMKFLLHSLGNGMDTDENDVTFLKSARAKVTGNVPVQLDGELVGKLPLAFEIADWRLEVLVPKMTLVTPHLVPANQELRGPLPTLSEPLAGSSL